MLEPSGLYYPYRFARYFLLGMQDVLGAEGLDAIVGLAGLTTYLSDLPPDTLERKFDFAYLAAVSGVLEDWYGARGGRGLALRIGRSWFIQGFHTFGALAGLAHPAFQSLPLNRRAQISLDALAAIFNQYSDQQTVFSIHEATYQLTVDVSPMAWGRQSDRPVCHALVGLFQECLRQASGGYEFLVHESACRAAGHDECIFVINQKPIGQTGG
ncbi:MAG: 4-vinyl reductase [Anaerolineae bacterium]|nr:4-vinyl reductase [Anaerolineae bacterium]